MNTAVRAVARKYLSGHELTEGLLNHIEVAIRAFDPCLSCATHALGRMPLELRLEKVGASGTASADCTNETASNLLDRLVRHSDGRCEHLL